MPLFCRPVGDPKGGVHTERPLGERLEWHGYADFIIEKEKSLFSHGNKLFCVQIIADKGVYNVLSDQTAYSGKNALDDGVYHSVQLLRGVSHTDYICPVLSAPSLAAGVVRSVLPACTSYYNKFTV